MSVPTCGEFELEPECELASSLCQDPEEEICTLYSGSTLDSWEEADVTLAYEEEMCTLSSSNRSLPAFLFICVNEDNN